MLLFRNICLNIFSFHITYRKSSKKNGRGKNYPQSKSQYSNHLKRQDMDYQISNKTKELTKQCPYNFSCLTGDNWEMCSVKFMAKHIGLFLQQCLRKGCPYCIPLIKTHICKCPTRYELCKRYQV